MLRQRNKDVNGRNKFGRQAVFLSRLARPILMPRRGGGVEQQFNQHIRLPARPLEFRRGRRDNGAALAFAGSDFLLAGPVRYR
jgi:hypothetical protein